MLGQRETRGFWDQNQIKLHINVLEMLAVKLAITFFQNELPNQTLLLLCDNATAVAYLRKEGGTRSLTMCHLAIDILQMLDNMCVTLVVRHIPSKRNVLVDTLSRTKPLSTEWQLNKAVFAQILELAPVLEIDLFATRINTQLDQFVSPIPDPLAQGVDALTAPWPVAGVLYVLLPQVLIPHVLARFIGSEYYCY